MVETSPSVPSENKPPGVSLPRLLSKKSSSRLRQVASLRARGVGDHVDLPQLVVCGDQSAGKSSILEGLTGLQFPRQEGVCTKFPTEIILEHSESPLSISATILPSPSRDAATKERLLSFHGRLADLETLPEAIATVGSLMGIRGFKSVVDGPAFADDILRIKVSGPTGLQLTVVDLPGLISVHGDDQTEADMKMVHQMVDSYAANSRTIILAVVQAGNDIANQSIIQKSRQFDKTGQRTVGIITKPDLINEGSEKRISLLARNEDTTKLKLGFFLVKNPTPTEMANGITADERHRNEMTFFQSSPWKEQGLHADRVGIVAFRVFLQTLLDSHIERELPRVRQEIKNLMERTKQQTIILGEERQTTSHLRIFLSRLSMKFHGLVLAGLNGNYHEADPRFFDGDGLQSNPLRLRAVVHQLNTDFSNYLRENGQKRKVVTPLSFVDAPKEIPEEDQLIVTENEMKAWVKQVYVTNRGRELPGNYSHILLSELFHIQSSRWHQIAQDHVDNVYNRITLFVKAALQHVTNDDKLFNELLELVESSLALARAKANKELRELQEDEQSQPITYNHYYTDTVQNSRHETIKSMIKKSATEISSGKPSNTLVFNPQTQDGERILASLQRRVIVDMDEQACTEAIDALKAYYKVARKTFVDNVCRQVIERHLLRNLPQIFCPESVAAFSDEELQRIAAETPGNIERRRSLLALHESLESSLMDLRK